MVGDYANSSHSDVSERAAAREEESGFSPRRQDRVPLVCATSAPVCASLLPVCTSAAQAGIKTIGRRQKGLGGDLHGSIVVVFFPSDLFAAPECSPRGHRTLRNPYRSVTFDSTEIQNTAIQDLVCDHSLLPGWYRFKVNNKPAEMPTTCVEVRRTFRLSQVWGGPRPASPTRSRPADEPLRHAGAAVAVPEGRLAAAGGRGPPALRLRHLAVLPRQRQGLLPVPGPHHRPQLRGLPGLLPAANAGLHGILRQR